MAVLLGTLLGIPFWLLGLFRVIRVSGYWRAVEYMRRGRVLIVANHPSLIETFLIPLVFWPWAMLRLRMFPWSLPDKNLFKGFTPEHHERLRCIRVGRDDTLESRKLNWSAMKGVMEHFERQQCFVAHLEGGRTSKQAEHVAVGPDRMGKIKNGQILKAASKKGAWIMPLHVKMTDAMSRDLPGFGESLRDRLGTDRLMWGSDMPNVERFCTYKQSLDYVRKYCPFLTAREKDRILGDNCAAFYGIDSGA